MDTQKYTPEKTIPCKDCGKFFSNESHMLIHFLQYHRKTIDVEVSLEPFACSVCDFKCVSYTEFQNHLIKEHQILTLFCKLCSFKCNTDSFLKSHMKVHNKKRIAEEIVECVLEDEGIINDVAIDPLACLVCDLNFISNEELQNHLAGHKVTTLCCKLCRFKCNDESVLKSHMRVHNNEKTKVIVEYVEVKDNSNKNENDSYSCSDCGESFPRYMHLKWHLLTHGKKKYYSCLQCPYKTIYKYSFTQHVKKHSGAKLFVCTECDYKTENEISLTKHKNTHEQRDRKLKLRKIRRLSGKSESSTTSSYVNLNYFSAYCTFVSKANGPRKNKIKHIMEKSKNQPKPSHIATQQKINKKEPKAQIRKRNGQFAKNEKAKECMVLVNRDNIHQNTEIKDGLRKYGNIKRKSALPFKCSYCSAYCASLKQINMHKEIHEKHNNNNTGFSQP